MAVKGYTNQYLVSDVIGKHDGVPPVGMLNVLIEAAENWIDRHCGRAWLISSVTGEQHTVDTWPPTSFSHYRTWGGNDWWDWSASNRRDPVVTLDVVPVTAVTAVRARDRYVGATVTTLDATDYELLDADLGQLLVAASWYGTRLSVDYTTSTPLPADIQLAASLLVAYWVQPMLNSGLSSSNGIQSYRIGEDLSVTFQSSSQLLTLSAPPDVLRLVDQHRSVMHAF